MARGLMAEASCSWPKLADHFEKLLVLGSEEEAVIEVASFPVLKVILGH